MCSAVFSLSTTIGPQQIAVPNSLTERTYISMLTIYFNNYLN